MSFQFHGFFARFDEQVEEAARKQWPQAAVRTFFNPFHGLGVRLASADELNISPDDEEENWEHVMGAIFQMEDELPLWSAQFAGQKLIFLRAECFGGTCLYDGFLCCDGSTLFQVQRSSTLQELFAWFDVKLPRDSHFEPLTRHFRWY